MIILQKAQGKIFVLLCPRYDLLQFFFSFKFLRFLGGGIILFKMNGTQTLLRDTITFVCTREEYSIEKIVLDQIIDLTIDNFLNLL